MGGFLLHVLPGGSHRIRHDGRLAKGRRKAKLALVREFLGAPKPEPAPSEDEEASIKAPMSVGRHCGRARPICRPSPVADRQVRRRRIQRQAPLL